MRSRSMTAAATTATAVMHAAMIASIHPLSVDPAERAAAAARSARIAACSFAAVVAAIVWCSRSAACAPAMRFILA